MSAFIYRGLILLLVAGAVALLSCTGGLQGAPREKPPRRLSIAEVEKERPDRVVTVQFRVEETGRLLTLRREGDPPYDPIQLLASLTQDKRGKFQVTIVGKALVHLHSVGIAKPAEHLRGKVVEVTGKVRAVKYPQITRGDQVEISKDNWTNYEMVMDN